MTLKKSGSLGKALALTAAIGITPMAQASFIANFHHNLNPGNNTLFIFGAENTSGTITGNDGFTENFLIDATGVYQRNFGSAGREMGASIGGQINNLSLFVDSSNPISGIALNRGSSTTDQTNLLDTNALGKEYRVLSYTGNHGSGSQMSVTATTDNTVVTIESPTTLNGNPANTPIVVTLQKGESVFYNTAGGGDVSGTKVTSTEDVAVFSGASCTNVPTNVFACDHLVSQQFSVDKFDTEFKIVENFGAGVDGDVLRVLAAEDNTEVYMNGVLMGTINAGEFLEIDGVGNADITATKPVTVGQYVRGQGGSRTTGDPAFAIIPSVNQTLSDYVFATPVGGDSFNQNFLNVAIDQSAAGSLMLNGSSVDTSGFQLLGTTLFGNIAIGAGFGNVFADSPFLATTSGFSNFDSFFNPIATSFSTGASPNPNNGSVPVPGTIGLIALGLGLLWRRKEKSLAPA